MPSMECLCNTSRLIADRLTKSLTALGTADRRPPVRLALAVKAKALIRVQIARDATKALLLTEGNQDNFPSRRPRHLTDLISYWLRRKARAFECRHKGPPP